MMSEIQRGAVVKIWHFPKGHDYVVCGQDSNTKELLLLKLNCINQDGTIHKSTKKFHKTLSFTTVGSNRVVSGVSKILGTADISDVDIDGFIQDKNLSGSSLPLNKKFVCAPMTDNRQAVTY